MPQKPISLWSLCFWIFAGLLLLATIAIPGTLMLHWNNIRALFNIQYGKTEVVGQIYSGPLNIPYSSFNQSVTKGWAVQSGESIDAYMLSESYRWPERDTPSGDLWRGHRLIEWGAIAATRDAYDAAYYEVPPSRRKCPRAFNIIQIAQHEHPDNGALWLAEAVAHFANADDDSAIAALNIAAEKPNWRSKENAAYRHLNALLQREGLPAFEAASEAEAATRNKRELRYGLQNVERLMTKAIQNLEDDRFASLLDLLYRLDQCRWVDIDRAWPTVSPLRSDELLEAMTARLNQASPSEQKESTDDWRKVERSIAHDFAATFVGEAAAFETTELHHSWTLQLRQWRERNLWNQNGFEKSWIAARACGLCALMMLAFLASAIAIDIPFLLVKDHSFIRTAPIRKVSFWIVALIVLTACALLLYRASNITLRTSSLSGEVQALNRTFIIKAAICFTSLVIVLFVARCFAKAEDRRHLFVVPVIVLVSYLTLVCMAANVRDALVTKYQNSYLDVGEYWTETLDVSDIIASP